MKLDHMHGYDHSKLITTLFAVSLQLCDATIHHNLV